jgi:hypothetical protein
MTFFQKDKISQIIVMYCITINSKQKVERGVFRII